MDTAEERELMDSFHYWSLHSVVRFSAAQFVDIDGALLYAVGRFSMLSLCDY